MQKLENQKDDSNKKKTIRNVFQLMGPTQIYFYFKQKLYSTTTQ